MGGHREARITRGAGGLRHADQVRRIKEMIIPSLLPILVPIVLVLIVNFLMGPGSGVQALGGLLIRHHS